MGRERERKRIGWIKREKEDTDRVWKRQMERMAEVREEDCEDRVTATRPAKVAITHEGRKKREEQ